MKRIQALASEAVVVFRSPDPENIYCYSPGIERLPSGRLVATCDLGGKGVKGLPGLKSAQGDFCMPNQGKVFTSDDQGRTWIWRADFPLMHARPFACGNALYILGHSGDLGILRSVDEGESWTETTMLTSGQSWHQAPCNVIRANGNIYMVMERRCYDDCRAWSVSILAPVLMRARLTDDLLDRNNWTFASELTFRDVCDYENLDYFNVPFFPMNKKSVVTLAPGRECAPAGWLEANVVRIVDPAHYWYDPLGKTYHMWMRAHTGGTGYAAVVKAIEQEDGSIITMLETAPSGKKALFVPCPGGQMKFHIIYDEPTRLFWLLSTQATDSMTRADLLPPDRFDLPNNERRRLQLHFSKNCIDWCFAGLVAIGEAETASRHYASMVVDGDDLQILSRSGDIKAICAHNGNLITSHRIHDFRSLMY